MSRISWEIEAAEQAAREAAYRAELDHMAEQCHRAEEMRQEAEEALQDLIDGLHERCDWRVQDALRALGVD